MKDTTQNEKHKAFLTEIIEVCRRHGFSLSHEDPGGAFLIHPFNETDAEWLRVAWVDDGLKMGKLRY